MTDNMNTRNDQSLAEEHPAEIPYSEWLDQLPSDVSTDVYNMGYTGYPDDKGPSYENFTEEHLKELFDEIFEEGRYGLDRQVGGTHYQELAIQPMEYSFANKLDPVAHSIIKYATRAGRKHSETMEKEIQKIIHCAELWLDLIDKYEK